MLRASLARRLAALCACLTALSACGSPDPTHIRETEQLPKVVFGGGGGLMEIDVACNRPARLVASFERWSERDESQILSSFQDLTAGSHHFQVDVADATYGYLEVSIPDAQVGSRIVWAVSLDGVRLDREEVELREPLEPGYAFFVQFEFDEIAELRQYAQR